MERVRQTEECSKLRLRVDHLEMLLCEADHRIANSLQLASAVAGHEAMAVRDLSARSRLLAMQNYIEAIAGVHQLLSRRPADAALPLHDYLWRLITRLQSAVAVGGLDRRILLRADPLHMEPEVAVWIGMVVVELVSNACKYGYGAAEPGEVRVILANRSGGFVLEVEDDGVGFDPDAPPRGSGLGGRMIRALAQRIGGEFHYLRGALGARAVLAAPGAAFGAPSTPRPGS